MKKIKNIYTQLILLTSIIIGISKSGDIRSDPLVHLGQFDTNADYSSLGVNFKAPAADTYIYAFGTSSHFLFIVEFKGDLRHVLLNIELDEAIRQISGFSDDNYFYTAEEYGTYRRLDYTTGVVDREYVYPVKSNHKTLGTDLVEGTNKAVSLYADTDNGLADLVVYDTTVSGAGALMNTFTFNPGYNSMGVITGLDNPHVALTTWNAPNDLQIKDYLDPGAGDFKVFPCTMCGSTDHFYRVKSQKGTAFLFATTKLGYVEVFNWDTQSSTDSSIHSWIAPGAPNLRSVNPTARANDFTVVVGDVSSNFWVVDVQSGNVIDTQQISDPGVEFEEFFLTPDEAYMTVSGTTKNVNIYSTCDFSDGLLLGGACIKCGKKEDFEENFEICSDYKPNKPQFYNWTMTLEDSDDVQSLFKLKIIGLLDEVPDPNFEILLEYSSQEGDMIEGAEVREPAKINEIQQQTAGSNTGSTTVIIAIPFNKNRYNSRLNIRPQDKKIDPTTIFESRHISKKK